MLDFKFGDGKIIEFEVLSDAKRKRLISTVCKALTGAIKTDYHMTGEWLTLESKCFKMPEVIVRHRRKMFNKVKRALEELYRYDLITSYTLNPDGYIRVNWFEGYIHIERQSWSEPHQCAKVIIESEMDFAVSKDQWDAEYLRDRIFLASNDFLRLLQPITVNEEGE